MEVHADSRGISIGARRSVLLTSCSQPGCTTLTIGGTCVMHDPAVRPTYGRGAPFAQLAPFVRTTQREVRSRVPSG